MDDTANSRRQPQRARALATPDPTPPGKAPFSWSSSLLTMITLLGGFIILCTIASAASTMFALKAAQPMYALYPSLVASMLVGGVCALICYLPTTLAVLCFQVMFGTDIRKGHSPPPRRDPTGRGPLVAMGWSLMRDGSATIKLALVITPIYVMALGSGETVVESKSLEAAGGGQLAAAIMTLRIMTVGMREIWDMVPMVVFRWDRDATR